MKLPYWRHDATWRRRGEQLYNTLSRRFGQCFDHQKVLDASQVQHYLCCGCLVVVNKTYFMCSRCLCSGYKQLSKLPTSEFSNSHKSKLTIPNIFNITFLRQERMVEQGMSIVSQIQISSPFMWAGKGKKKQSFRNHVLLIMNHEHNLNSNC